MSQPRIAPLARVPTGIVGLDRILNGGLFSGGAYIVMGVPGSGKTTLGNQVAFQFAKNGGAALYLTLLSESHARMLQHLSGFAFLDPSVIGETLTYVSGFHTLESEGLSGVLTLLRKEIRERRITLLVIDGLVTAESTAVSDIEVKKFIHEVQTLMSLTGCTALLLTNLSVRPSYPAHTMVDGIIELRDDVVGLRAERQLTVFKFRGGAFLRGRHTFEIAQPGLVVSPRLESLPIPSPSGEERDAQIEIGIAELDTMLGGGVAAGASTLISGPPGSGKTLVGLTFLHTGAEAGEPGLYLGFGESAPELVRRAAAFGLDLQRHVADGRLELSIVSDPEARLDSIAQMLLEQVARRRPRRVFIDGIAGFRAVASDAQRVGSMVVALIGHLHGLGVTTVMSDDMDRLLAPQIEPSMPVVSARVDNIIIVRYVELRSQLHRLISIVKRRGSSYDRSIREFDIHDGGIRVASTFDSAEAILGGLAHPTNGDSHPRRRSQKRATHKPRGKPRGRKA